MDPSARKLQEPRIKQKKSKKINRTGQLCTPLATNYISPPAIDPLTPDQFNAENPKSPKQTFDLYHVTISCRAPYARRIRKS